MVDAVVEFLRLDVKNWRFLLFRMVDRTRVWGKARHDIGAKD